MKIFAETERLILREITMDDVNGFFEMDSDREVQRYLGNKPLQSLDEAKAAVQRHRQLYIDDGIGRWAIVHKATNNFIGWTGFKLVKEPRNNHSNYYDLGYRLLRKYWGKGFATESAIASLHYGFDRLKFKEVYAAAAIENTGSNNVLKKVGFTFIETFYLDGIKHNWYRMDKTGWSEAANTANSRS